MAHYTCFKGKYFKNGGIVTADTADQKKIKEIWDNVYATRNSTNSEYEFNRRLIWTRLHFLLNKILLKSSNSKSIILEAGCGNSTIMKVLASQGITVVGLDLSIMALKRAHKSFKDINLIQADIFKLPFRSESFDLVYNVGVIEHFKNPKIALLEMCRVRNSLGALIVVVPNKFSLWTLGRIFKTILNKLHLSEPWAFGFERSYSKGEFKHLFEEIGFKKFNFMGCGTFEGFYITSFFFLKQPKLVIKILYPLLSNDTKSISGKMLHIIAYMLEKMDVFGKLVVASSK